MLSAHPMLFDDIHPGNQIRCATDNNESNFPSCVRSNFYSFASPADIMKFRRGQLAVAIELPLCFAEPDHGLQQRRLESYCIGDRLGGYFLTVTISYELAFQLEDQDIFRKECSERVLLYLIPHHHTHDVAPPAGLIDGSIPNSGSRVRIVIAQSH